MNRYVSRPIRAVQHRTSTLAKVLVPEFKDKHAPYRLSRADWRAALGTTWSALFDKQLITLAGGIAFFATLALLPFAAGMFAIIGLIASPNEANSSLTTLTAYMPPELARFVNEQLISLATSTSANIATIFLTIAVGLWISSAAMDNLMQSLNTVYNIKETRRPLQFKIESIALMAVVMFNALLIVLLLLISSDALRESGAPELLIELFPFARWVLIFLIISTLVTLIYHYGPDQNVTRWRWSSWGAALATVVWMVGTSVFFAYIQYASNFSQTYGILAGMFILMSWVGLSVFIVILGAQINQHLEYQVNKKTRS